MNSVQFGQFCLTLLGMWHVQFVHADFSCLKFPYHFYNFYWRPKLPSLEAPVDLLNVQAGSPGRGKAVIGLAERGGALLGGGAWDPGGWCSHTFLYWEIHHRWLRAEPISIWGHHGKMMICLHMKNEEKDFLLCFGKVCIKLFPMTIFFEGLHRTSWLWSGYVERVKVTVTIIS